MFFLFNKRKFASYCISLGTVLMLFAVAFMVRSKFYNTIETMGVNVNQYPLTKLENANKEVAITINLEEEKLCKNSEQIIDLLNKDNVKITVFVTEEILINNREFIKKIIENNNEIGILFDLKNNEVKEETIKNKLLNIKNLFKNIANKKINLIRLKNSESNERIISIVKEINLCPVSYNIAILDQLKKENKEIIKNIFSGSICNIEITKKNEFEKINEIIKLLRKNNFKFIKISDSIKI